MFDSVAAVAWPGPNLYMVPEVGVELVAGVAKLRCFGDSLRHGTHKVTHVGRFRGGAHPSVLNCSAPLHLEHYRRASLSGDLRALL